LIDFGLKSRINIGIGLIKIGVAGTGYQNQAGAVGQLEIETKIGAKRRRIGV
jgi:hypothetical protein